jgi:phosphoglycerol transferase MdoB-like AlkP superfamily enzyme
MIKCWPHAGFSIIDLIYAFCAGFIYDLASFAFLLPFFAVWLAVIPMSWRNNRIWLSSAFIVQFIVAYFLAVQILCEWAFWQEFESRFNFIAVDYLVYTKEVLGNIWQSYHVVPLFLMCAVAALIWVLVSRRLSMLHCWPDYMPQKRGWVVAIAAILCALVSFGVTDEMRQQRNNQYADELAGNGMFALFGAFRNNQLDYQRFYNTMPLEDAAVIVKEQLSTPDAVFLSSDPLNIQRKIIHTDAEKRMTVILITVESLSASFLGSLGSKKNLTPELDKLASDGLLFTNLYATGNRTVRGLEALSLSVPPTPGQSIVRRPNSDNLFTLGSVFKSKGYQTYFMYGGYGTFDNMNAYFAGNGYKVMDRLDLKKNQITAESIWGVADEDLYNMALREFDAESATGKPFFAHIMTTSNHPPYIFPDGRIDMQQGSRKSAVKYTDWAIGDFIRKSKNTAWGKNALFVIIADHCASSSGKTKLPLNGYHIPMIIWSPGNIQHQLVDCLISQIDVAPTLLGLLNFNYTSQFLGQDIFAAPNGPGRAFIATYQSMGYLRQGYLSILNPRKDPITTAVGQVSGSDVNPDNITKQSIAWYEYSSAAFSRGWMKAR